MDVEAARALCAEQLLPLPGRWQHSQGVAATAAVHAERLSLDAGVVVSAAWLHDVGYVPALRDTGFHPIDGARFLRQSGWSSFVCGLVAHHSCSRVEAGLRGLDEALSEFEDVRGLSRDVLWASDATTGPGGKRTDVAGRVREVVLRYGATHMVARCMLLIAPELESAERNVRDAEQAGSHR